MLDIQNKNAQFTDVYLDAESADYDTEHKADAQALDVQETADASVVASAIQSFDQQSPSPWADQASAQGAADKTRIFATAVAEFARAQASADAQMTGEIGANDAQESLTLAQDQAEHDQTTSGAQAEHDLTAAQAGSLAAQAASHAYFASLPGLLSAPAADVPLTLTGDYGHSHDIGGYQVGNTADSVDAVINLMFSTPADSEPSGGTFGFAGAWGWGGGGWSGSWGGGGWFGGSALMGYLPVMSGAPPQIMMPGMGSTGAGIAGATWTNPAQTGNGGSVFGPAPGVYAQTGGGGSGGQPTGQPGTGNPSNAQSGSPTDPTAQSTPRKVGDEEGQNKAPGRDAAAAAEGMAGSSSPPTTKVSTLPFGGIWGALFGFVGADAEAPPPEEGGREIRFSDGMGPVSIIGIVGRYEDTKKETGVKAIVDDARAKIKAQETNELTQDEIDKYNPQDPKTAMYTSSPAEETRGEVEKTAQEIADIEMQNIRAGMANLIHGRPYRVVIIGYSYGGDKAIEVANILAKMIETAGLSNFAEIHLRTIDAVDRKNPLGGPSSIKPEAGAVASWYNWFQTVVPGFHGEHMDGANNENLEEFLDGLDVNLLEFHKEIDKKVLEKLIASLLAPKER